MPHSTKHPPLTEHEHSITTSTHSVFFTALLALCLSLTSGVTLAKDTAASIVTHVQLETFQEPEVVPNTSLEDPQPVPGSAAILRRTDNELTAVLATKGLPLGVYTFWWHLTHEDGELSILWAGNDFVSNRRGNSQLQTTLLEGEENAPGAIFLGHGLQPGAGKTVRVEFTMVSLQTIPKRLRNSSLYRLADARTRATRIHDRATTPAGILNVHCSDSPERHQTAARFNRVVLASIAEPSVALNRRKGD
ncbi:hypothetical protein N8766_01615 [bacterium]|nr:hypothetical protein [bacterium]MDB4798941.1 hypothetical protein [Verrucomicrobiota bacterium]